MAKRKVDCPGCGASVPATGVCGFCGATVLLEGVAGKLLSSDLRCPRCPGSPGMRGLEHEGTRVDLCTKCHGAWFGLGRLEAALASAAKRPPAPGEGEEGPAHGGIEPVRYSKCPVCGGGMARVALARKPLVLIDRCPAHGDWCDGGEFGQLKFVARTRGMEAIGQPLPEAPAKPSKSKVPVDLPIDGGLAGFTFGGRSRRHRGPDVFDILWNLFATF